jgi:hypothetical protein
MTEMDQDRLNMIKLDYETGAFVDEDPIAELIQEIEDLMVDNNKYKKIIATIEDDENYPSYESFGRRVEEIIEEDFHD